MLGGQGFKGLCKLMLFVVQVVVELVGCVVMEYGVKNLEVWIKGLGLGCELVVCVLYGFGIKIIVILDVILILYNGCCLLKCCCI